MECATHDWYPNTSIAQIPASFPLWLAATSPVPVFNAPSDSNLDVNTTLIMFRFTDINFGFTSAVRRLATLALFCLAMGRTMGIVSSGWHYAPTSTWESFFEPATLVAAPPTAVVQYAARDSSHHRVAYFYRRPDYLAVLQRYLRLARPSAYAAARRLLFASLWRPSDAIKARVHATVCETPLRFGAYAAIHVRRGDKTSGHLREIPETSVVPIDAYLVHVFARRARTLFVMSDDYTIVNDTRSAVARAYVDGYIAAPVHVVSIVPATERGHHAHMPLSATNAHEAFERFIVEIEIARHAQFVVGDHRSNVLSLIALLHECGNDTCTVEHAVPLQYCAECTPCVISLAPRDACH